MAYNDVLWKTAADGWATISSDDKLAAVLRNTTNTPWGISAYTQEPITPQWVIDAVKQYNDNGGFAGISLFEYLDKISGERVEEPKHTF